MEQRLSGGSAIIRATIFDVAAKAGVSGSTVSRILKKKYDLYPQKTIEKVLQAAKSLNYVPNIMAQSLSRQRSNIIGIYGFFYPTNPVHLEVLLGVVQGLNKTHYGVTISNLVGSTSKDRKTMREAIQGGGLCGLILSSMS